MTEQREQQAAGVENAPAKEESRGHHAHHHHHHTRRHRLKRWWRKKKKLVRVLAAFLLVFAAALGAVLFWHARSQQKYAVTRLMDDEWTSAYRRIEYEGKSYKYNQSIRTVLYAGLDSTGPMEKLGTYGDAPRSDTIGVLIIDPKHEKVSILTISRNAMMRFKRYSVFGDRYFYLTEHLAMSYVYGDGMEESVDILKDAVEGLLGFPLGEYVVVNRSSIPFINDLVDGVTVTVPNDDLEELDPPMKKGDVVTLDESNVESFVRHRDLYHHLSNEGRMERQAVFIQGFLQRIREMIPKQAESLWKKLQGIDEFCLTSVTKSKYLYYVNLLEQTGMQDVQIYKVPGEEVIDTYYDEFIVDKEALQKLLIEIFYEEER